MSTLHELFAAQAERTPGATALIHRHERTTYAELAERVRGLAARLRAMGVGPEVPVGVCLERTPGLVAALLAVMEAGGCYVPLDPAYPRERLGFMLEDSGAPVVVTRADLAERLPEHGAEILCLPLTPLAPLSHRTPARPGEGGKHGRGRPSPGGRECDGRGDGGEGSAGNLAYLIYTSGSTGRPKGVALEHRSAVAFAHWARQVFSDEERRGVLAATSIAFDLSIFELFVTLAWGGTVILAANALELPDLPAADEVTLINTVPSAMAELVRMEAVPPSVRTVNLAGEPLKNSLAQGIHAFPHVRRVLNLYGPSEDTTYSTWTEVGKGAAREPSIGRPVDGTGAWLVGPDFQLVPGGEVGEILLTGEGLARGYFRRPELTAERFLPDPFSGVPGARLYRTGDLGRRRPDGEIDYLGRIDHQVKIRGFRIELGEIEVALEACAGVREAVAVAREDAPGDKRLVAYVVAPPGEREGLVPALRARLGERLPAYMVPSAFVVLDGLPRTPNGKIDRGALPAPAALAAQGAEAPRNAVEETLAGLFREVLGCGPVGVGDSFFDLGGDSLLAHRALARVRAAFGLDLPQGTLFEAPTVVALAGRIAASEGRLPVPPLVPVPPAADEPLSYAQERLWFHEHLAPGLPVYNIPAVLRLEGPLRPEVLERALAEVVRRHEPLRASFPEPEDGVPRQRIAPALGLPLPLVDLSGLPADVRDAEAERREAAEAGRPFALAEGPVVRAVLVRRAAESHALLLTLHHLVADGGSLEVLRDELLALYPAFARGLPSPLPELPVRYADYVAWQRRWLEAGELEAQLAWWCRALAGAPPALELPADRPRTGLPTFRGARLRRELPPELDRAARALARREKGTLFTVVLAAFFALLHRWSGEDDLIAGVPVAGRHRAELERLVGLFVNTLILRCGAAGEPSFAGLLARVRASALGALAHQDLPFERLLAELRLERQGGRVPLAQVLFVMEREGRRQLAPGLSVLLCEGDSGTAKVDLSLYVIETDGGLAAVLEHDADLYDRATAERLLESYGALLAAAVADPAAGLSDLPLLLAGEREQAVRTARRAPPLPEPAPEEPATPLERELAAIWSEVLGSGPAGRNDDFFRLGGHSLLAMRVFSRVRARWGVRLPVRALFEASTLSGLARRIEEALRQAGSAEALDRPVPVPRQGGLPLSFSQQRFWFLERLAPGGATLNIPNPLRLAGPLEPSALAEALAGLVRRHETLRTTFAERAGTPVQVVHAPQAPPLALADLSALPAALREREAGRLTGDEARRPFDLERGPLLRAALLRLGGAEHRLLLTLHHIVADGWSVEVLVRELGTLYAAAAERRPAALPPLPFQYADYAAWQRRRLDGDPGGIAWWRERLAGMEPLRLPLDRPRPAERSARGRTRELTLPDGLAAEVRALARREGTSLFMTLLAAFLALLHRETGQTDLVVGTPVANRDRTDLEGLIGAFVNTLVLRVDLAGDPGFRALLGRVRETALAAYARQEVPFEKLVEELEPRRDSSRTPLVQSMVSIQTAPAEPPRFAGVTLEPVWAHTGTAQLDLTLFALDLGQRIDLTCEYAADLFDGATVERLLARFQALLAAAVAEPEQALSRLPLPEEGTAPRPVQPVETAPAPRPAERLQESLEERKARLSDEQRAMLARRLRGRKAASVSSSASGAARALVPIDPAGTQPPFFCVHPAGGDVLCFHPLARHLGPDLPFYGLQSPGIAADTEPFGSIEEMAASYVAEIRQVQPEGPWRIGGWSLGGVVAFEMAQQLARAGREVELLAILDTVPRLADTQPAAAEPGFWEDDARWLLDIAVYAEGLWGKSLGLGYEELRSLGDAERLACCAGRLAALQLLPPGAGVPWLARLLRVFKANVRAGLSYDPRPYPGRITLFRAADAPEADPALGWQACSPEPVEVHVCPGTHVTLLADANAAALAERLRSCLDRRSVEIPA